MVRLVTPAHRGSPNNSQATAVEDGFEVLSSPGPHAEDDDGDDDDGAASEIPQVTNSPAATVTPRPVVVPDAVGPAAATIASTTTNLPALYTPGYILPSNRPDNAILPPANLITPIYGYHIPSLNSGGPLFCVSRGRDIGIFCGW